jgi:hypothetical protein
MRSPTSASSSIISNAAKVGSPEDELFLQPWFLSKELYLAVRRLLPPSQMLKMRYYFEDYGCLKCGKLNALYCSNGLCRGCSVIVRSRVALALKRRFKKFGVKTPQEPFERYLTRVFDRKPGSRLTSAMCPRRAR